MSLLDLLPFRSSDANADKILSGLTELIESDASNAWSDDDFDNLGTEVSPSSAQALAFAVSLLEHGRASAARAFVLPLLRRGGITQSDAIRLMRAAVSQGTEYQVDIITTSLAWRENAFLLVERAKLHRGSGASVAALEDFAAAHRLVPSNAAVICEYVWALLATGERRTALAIATAGIRMHPEDANLMRALALAEQSCGNLAEAEAILRRSIVAGSATEETHKLLTSVLTQRTRNSYAALRTSGPTQITREDIAALEREVAQYPEESETVRDIRDDLRRLSDLRALFAGEHAVLFDRKFYASQLVSSESIPDDMLAHYVFRGAHRRLSPSPYFEPWTYLDAVGDGVEDALFHYLTIGAAKGFAFHPFFEEKQGAAPSLLKIAQDPDTNIGHGGASDTGLAPSEPGKIPQGSVSAGRRRWGDAVLTEPTKRCVRSAVEAKPALRPLAERLAVVFDQRFYAQQLAMKGIPVSPGNELLHYIQGGWTKGLDPHPLFRTTFYLKAYPNVITTATDPLTHYLTNKTPNVATHPLVKFKNVGTTGVLAGDYSLLEGYLSFSVDARPSVVAFFDRNYYCKCHPDFDWMLVDPLLHYLVVGQSQGWSPHPGIDAAYVRSHHMAKDGIGLDISVLEYYENHPQPKPRPFALFDPAHYLSTYDDLRKAELCPATHYVLHGMWEDRQPSRLMLSRYVLSQETTRFFVSHPPIWDYLTLGRNHRCRVLFVGHDGTRTGAPAVLYRLIKHFSTYDNIECICLLDQGGALVPDYAAVALTLIKEKNRYHVSSSAATRSEFFAELTNIMTLLEDNPPEIVICNSAEIRLYSEFFGQLGLPVISLVHEIASVYPPGELESLAVHSSKMIFPANFVRDVFLQNYHLDPDLTVLLPQGLLRDSFGDRPRGDRVKVYRDAGIDVSDNDVLVIGCGTVDGRKGFDLFVRTARLVREARPQGPVRFIWIGGHGRWRMNMGATYDSIAHWASWENMQAGDAELVHVISEVRHLEPYLVNADLFLLTSRADPFPCVVHDAMASRLPVLCFADTGGSPDVIRDDAGLVLPYLDTKALAEAVISLSENPGRRSAMGEAGRERIKTEYRFAHYAEKVMALVRSQLGAGSDHFGERRVREMTRGRVYFGVEDWEESEGNALLSSLVSELSKSGFEAEILISRGRYGSALRKADPGLYLPRRDEVTPAAPFRILQPASADPSASVAGVMDFLSEAAPCVLVTENGSGLAGLAVDLPPNVAVLGTVSSDDDASYRDAYRLGLFWNRVVATSDGIRRNLTDLNPDFERKIKVIRPGLRSDPAHVRDDDDDDDGRATPGDRLRLIYLGDTIGPHNRLADYVRLAEVLAAGGVPFEMTLLEDDEKLEGVRKRLMPHVRAGMVKLLPTKAGSDLTRILDGQHFVLALSGSTRSELGAMIGLRHGCIPVVYEGASGLSDILENGVNSIVVPRGRIEAVVATMKRLSEDGSDMARLSGAASATVEREGLTIERMAEDYGRLVTDVLAEISDGIYPRRSHGA